MAPPSRRSGAAVRLDLRTGQNVQPKRGMPNPSRRHTPPKRRPALKAITSSASRFPFLTSQPAWLPVSLPPRFLHPLPSGIHRRPRLRADLLLRLAGVARGDPNHSLLDRLLSLSPSGLYGLPRLLRPLGWRQALIPGLIHFF